MDIIKDSHQVSRMDVVDTGRRRRWTFEKKLAIVEESFATPRMASATARRHGLSTSLLFSWRKAYREGRLCEEAVSPGLVPAVLLPDSANADVDVDVDADADPPEPEEQMVPPRAGRMTVVCTNGRRLIVGPDVDEAALARVLAVLERLPVRRSRKGEDG